MKGMNVMNQSVKRISEGAMMVAVVGMVLFFNRQTAGMFEYLLYWTLSFPILLYCVKYGLQAALLPAICMIILSFMLSVPTTIFYICSSLIIGLFYGFGVRKHFENKVLLGFTIFFTFVSYIITTIIFAKLFGYGSEDIEMIMKLLDLLQIQLPYDIAKIALVFAVLVAFIMSVLEALCIHLIAIILLRRLKIAEIKVKSIIDLSVPKWIGMISLIVILLFLGRNVLKLEDEVLAMITLAMACVSVIGIANGCIYLMCVLSLVGKKKWVFILPILALTPLIQLIVLFFGIYDMLIGGKQALKEAFYYGAIRKS